MTRQQEALLNLALDITQRGSQFNVDTIEQPIKLVINQLYASDWPHLNVIARRIVIDAIAQRGYFKDDSAV